VLTAPVGPAIASEIEVHSAGYAARGPRIDVIASLVRALIYLKPLAAVLEHLRHKRHSIETPVLVERSQDLLFGTNFNPFADSHDVWPPFWFAPTTPALRYASQ
jgi:hypothetical protein